MSYSKTYWTVTKIMEYINNNFDKVDFDVNVMKRPHIKLSSVELYFRPMEAYTSEPFGQKNIKVLGINFHGIDCNELHTKRLIGDALLEFFDNKHPIVKFNENAKRKVGSSAIRIQSLIIDNELKEYNSISYYPAVIEPANLSVHNLLAKKVEI